MKVLFLDIDGVINHHGANWKTDHWPLDPYCAFLVGKIKLDTDCEVVLSSSWRVHPEGTAEVEKRVVPLLGKTPPSWYLKETNHHSRRGEEIQKWLDSHPEVTCYAILDDEADAGEGHGRNFFRTSFYNGGLTEDIAQAVTAHLK
jgi:hypothetical protein